MSPQDERDLIWFLGYGQTIFEGSTWGDMVERAHAYAYGAVRCNSCHGYGFIQKGMITCEECNGMGFVPRKARNTDPDTWTARPTHGRGGEASYVPDEQDLSRWAVASRALERVGKVDREAADALTAYYGDHGTRWEPTGLGRIFAIYPLTYAGAKLLAASQARGTTEARLSADEILGVEADLQRQQDNDVRRTRLDRAKVEALALYHRGVRVWNENKAEQERRHEKQS